MRLVIVSGRSGSGKTISLHVLEDLGYYCVDNLPVDMLPGLVSRLQEDHPRLAVSIDARNLPLDVNLLKDVISELRQPGCEIIYLDADHKSLLRRFSETRRRHPLSNSKVSLQEAIEQEHALLRPLSSMADITIDTSHLTQHQLCALIRDRVARENTSRLQLLIQSFGFKNGMPADADFIFDVRCLPNPYWQPDLRALTGCDQAVADFLKAYPEVHQMVEDIIRFLDNWIPRFEADNRSYLTVGIGCTGGQHRSVYITEQLVHLANKLQLNVQVRHRDLKSNL
ncbi:MAG: RNase adaptor protein RapZ [Gammaproteobacteria bacterium 39-13]|nr:RNase adapter RapZ [Gammaproteobacteria bacterium]OJV89842.1 MAG: RNase adaptor protein RapZ [Gammaproteobacteria bacterium 39-13]